MHAIEVAAPSVAKDIEAALLADLRRDVPQGRNETVTLSVSDRDGALVAGLCGSTSYGWLLIKVLWVAPEWQRQGYGRALVADAILRAKGLGCHSVWLDTSNKEARQFYLGLGFELFGTLRNQAAQMPPGHKRLFLKRRIT